jgi:hypothetical protein
VRHDVAIIRLILADPLIGVPQVGHVGVELHYSLVEIVSARCGDESQNDVNLWHVSIELLLFPGRENLLLMTPKE